MPEKPLSVSALTKYIKYKFDHDSHLKDLLLEGEISNFKHNLRGHFYFTLKDDNSSIQAVMFKGSAQHVNFTPKDGMNIIVRGYISVFEVAGSYQVYVKKMEQVGLGNLYQAYLQLKEKLEKQGYFASFHKKELPKYPKQIAVLTSATGAAVRDIINILSRRYPLVKILVYPTTVQGEKAKHEIVENIEAADQNEANDLIIVGRGGGSIEDLWAFNEERVADAIYHCKTPIISAVGHETDFTIADFVADKRAPTPSGAAEIAVPDQKTIINDLNNNHQRLNDSFFRIIKRKKDRLEELLDRYVLKDPERLFERPLVNFESLLHRLQQQNPEKQLHEARKNVDQQTELLNRFMASLIDRKTKALERYLDKLAVLNPRLILNQGYTLAKKNGKVIKSIKDLSIGDSVEMEMMDGMFKATVKEKKEES